MDLGSLVVSVQGTNPSRRVAALSDRLAIAAVGSLLGTLLSSLSLYLPGPGVTGFFGAGLSLARLIELVAQWVARHFPADATLGDHLQHVRDKHVIYVAILEEKTDDFNRRYYQLQLEGSKTALELPGVLDEVVTLAVLKADDGSTYRGFVTGADNSFGFPSKDRSGRLDPIEEPHLGRLIAKCLGQANTSDNTN